MVILLEKHYEKYIYTVVSTEKYLPSSILAVANRKHTVHCQPKAWEILLETLLAAACKHYASHGPWTKLSEILTFAAAEANWLESAMLAQVSQLAKNSPNLWVYLSADGRLPGFFLSLQSMFLANCFYSKQSKEGLTSSFALNLPLLDSWLTLHQHSAFLIWNTVIPT